MTKPKVKTAEEIQKTQEAENKKLKEAKEADMVVE